MPSGGLTSRIARAGTSLAQSLVEAQRDVAWAPSEMKLARRQGLTRSRDPFSGQGIWGGVGIAAPDALTLSPGRRMAALLRQARAAHAYVQALDTGDRATVVAVAARLRVTYGTALSLVSRARANDLLLPKQPVRGRPEGRLTPRAKQLLRLDAPRSSKARGKAPRRKAGAERKRT